MGFVANVMPLLRVRPSRLASTPRVRVLGRDARLVRLAVDGLVCGVCAARTRSALARVPGVEGVRVDLERGTAELATHGEVSETALARALASVVVAAGLRMWIARGVARFSGSRQRGERA